MSYYSSLILHWNSPKSYNSIATSHVSLRRKALRSAFDLLDNAADDQDKEDIQAFAHGNGLRIRESMMRESFCASSEERRFLLTRPCDLSPQEYSPFEGELP